MEFPFILITNPLLMPLIQLQPEPSDILSSRVTVGLTILLDSKTQTERLYKYSDVPIDAVSKNASSFEKGWVSNPRFFPHPFDMMYLMLEGKEKHISGWWDGRQWNGLRLRSGNKIIKWKRNQEYGI